MIKVRIKWSRDLSTEEAWDKVCIWALEHFGLPGGRYSTELNIDYMDFIFKSKHDALMFALAQNGQLLEPA